MLFAAVRWSLMALNVILAALEIFGRYWVA